MIKKLINLIGDIIFILIGLMFSFIQETIYFGIVLIVMGISLIMYDIFNKDAKKFIKDNIERETNIKLRERTEKRIERNTTLLFALVISGSFASSKIYQDGLLGLGIFLFISYFYFLFDRIYLEKYMTHTDYLLKKI